MAQQSWIDGIVRWFDDLKGEGLIRDMKGNSYYVHQSTIEFGDKPKILKKNEKVKFQLIKDSHFTHVSKVREA